MVSRKTTKKTKRTSKKQNKRSDILKLALPIGVALLGGLGVTGAINLINQEKQVELKIEYSEKSVEPATYDKGGDAVEEIPTVEEIDGGGRFQDIISGDDTSLYYEKGSIEEVDTSSPTAFMNSTLNRCIIASNYFGAQCVSLARAFWWDYAGFDVSTCGTGLAKGMMQCSEENARDKFKVIWERSEIQAGTWIVLDGKTTGHICMALSNPIGNYVTCLGENQGGIPCENGVGGAGTNIINISLSNFIGGYTPLSYITPAPQPEPVPDSPNTGRQ